MAGAVRYATALVLIHLILAGAAAAQTNGPRHPTWWAKYQYLLKRPSKTAPATTESVAAGDNVDLSNECGPQSEAFITYDPLQATLAAGSSSYQMWVRTSRFAPPSRAAIAAWRAVR